MKLVRRAADTFVFDMGKREKRLLLEVLKLYPLIPTAHHRVSKAADATQLRENQKLGEFMAGPGDRKWLLVEQARLTVLRTALGPSVRLRVVESRNNKFALTVAERREQGQPVAAPVAGQNGAAQPAPVPAGHSGGTPSPAQPPPSTTFGAPP